MTKFKFIGLLTTAEQTYLLPQLRLLERFQIAVLLVTSAGSVTATNTTSAAATALVRLVQQLVLVVGTFRVLLLFPLATV